MTTHRAVPRHGVAFRGLRAAASVFLGAAAIALGGPCGGVAAQSPTVPPARRPDTLDAALNRVRWTGDRPPLLVVDAASVRPTAKEEGGAAPPPLVPTPAGTLTLRDVAAAFDRKIVAAGGVSVLAPTTMVVLNTRPSKGDAYAGLQPGDKMRLLLAGLTPAQWRKLGSADGLGAGDLSTPDQRGLFLSFLAEPFAIQKMVIVAGADGRRRGQPEGRPVALTPARRADVRLVLSRRASVYVPIPEQPNSFHFWEAREENPAGAELLVLRDQETFRRHDEAFGVTLRQEMRSVLKPGDLPFDSARLNPPVALNAEPGQTSVTVGDLVKRAGAACRLELYADARVARLPVRVLGGGETRSQARGGDVLKALCLALTGTFRKVTAGNESAYVLTDDVEGIGARQARIGAWASALERQVRDASESARAKIAAQNPSQYLNFAAADPFALSSGLTAKMEADRAPNRSRRFGPGTPLNVADLPAAYQQFLRDHAGGEGAGMTSTSPAPVFRPGQVGVQLKTRIAYLLPGTGVIEPSGNDVRGFFINDVDDVWESSLLPPPLPPETANEPLVPINLSRLSPASTTSALLARLATPDEAKRVVAEAAKRGVSQVWLLLPDAPATRTILDAAIAAGATARVGIVAVTSLLTRGKPDAAEENDIAAASLDLDIQGRPGREPAWLRLDTPEARAAITDRLARLVATPGLAGLVLENTAAPGYANPVVDQEHDRFNALLGASGYGFTPEMRLRFLRAESADPVDFLAYGNVGSVSLDLPFFGPEQSRGLVPLNESGPKPPAQRWTILRHEVNTAFLRGLFGALRKAAPALPLFLAERGEMGEAQWYGLWERADAAPPRFAPWFGPGGFDKGGQAWPSTQARRCFSSRNLVRSALPVGEKKMHPASGKYLPDTAKDWNGIVFDLRHLSADEVIALLGAAFAPATN